MSKGHLGVSVPQAVREADFSADSSLTEAQEPFKDTISLGFKTAQPGSVLLQTAQGVSVLLQARAQVPYYIKYTAFTLQ